MPPTATQTRPPALTTPQSRGEIILFEEKASSFDEGIMPLYHGTLTLRAFLSPGSADSLEMIHSIVEQNRQRDRERIGALERKVAELEAATGLDQPAPRKISRAQAKKEIKAHFRDNHGKTIYGDEIAEALNLDLMQVIEICEDLEREGKIAS